MLTLFGSKLTPIRKLLLMKMVSGGGSIVEETVTGNPLAFITNLARPLKSVLATWQPHQSGTGDPSPENIRPVVGMDGVNVWRTGSNVWDEQTESGAISTVTGEDISGNNIRTKNYVPVVSGAKYRIITVDGASNGFWALFYDKDKNVISEGLPDVVASQNARRLNNDYELTIPDKCAFIRWYFQTKYGETYNNDTAINFPSSVTTYSPYHGTSYSVAFPVVGKNLFDIDDGENGGINTSGQEVSASDNFRSNFIQIEPDTDYTLSATGTTILRMYWFEADKTFISPRTETNGTSFTRTSPSNAKYMRIVVVKNGSTMDKETAKACNIMLNSGSSALPYEPYTDTVYGGSLDLTTGVLTAEWVQKQVKDFTWSYNSSYGGYFTTLIRDEIVWLYDVYLLSDALKVYPNRVGSDSFAQDAENYSTWFYGAASATQKRLRIKDTNATSETDLINDIGNYHVLYKLAEPIVLATLSPTQITALIGNNTMWADADSLSVTYLKKG